MHLKITRSQRTGGMLGSTAIFIIDARVEFTSEEQGNINRYKLGTQVIYNSNASAKHLEAMRDGGSASTLAKNIYHLAAAKMALNISINSLQAGQHIECKSLDEVIAAEDALMEACTALRNYLDTAATFDGREVLLDFTTSQPVVAAQTTAPPPMLAAPPSSAASDRSSTAWIEPPSPSMAEMQVASPFYNATSSASSGEWLERVGNWWQSATVPERALAVGSGAFAAYILYLIF